jgi:hypothetical protein
MSLRINPVNPQPKGNTMPTNLQIYRTMTQLSKAGFLQWQVQAYPDWVARLSNKRQWRRLTRKVFGISVKA